MKIKVPNEINEMKLRHLQEITSEKDALKKCDFFIENICRLDPNKFDEIQKAESFRKWFSCLIYETEKAPLSFKVNGKWYHAKHVTVDGEKIATPLQMQLAFLIEAVNIKIDIEQFKGIDNMAALMYRQDWSKPFNIEEYFESAKMFEGLETKYSLWGMTKYNELILTLKKAYPILYQDNEETGKTEGRKMFDLLNAVSGDNPSQFENARSTAISDAFTWMEHKKIEHVKQKLNKK